MEAWDDVKQCPLNRTLVRGARDTEMWYVAKHKVYTYARVQEYYDETGAAPIDTRWIDTNKGDDIHPNYRSRWVAKDFKKAWIETIFAVSPNIEAIRLMLAGVANNVQED